MLPWPSVDCTSRTVAPLSIAWDACACLNQCGETRDLGIDAGLGHGALHHPMHGIIPQVAAALVADDRGASA
jgi:hypothetical protein